MELSMQDMQTLWMNHLQFYSPCMYRSDLEIATCELL